MKNIAILSTICLLLACSSCVPSLNPLYMEQDLIFDSSLIGVWGDKDTNETWVLASCPRRFEYILTYTDPSGKKGEFGARLVRVGDKTFLDIVPVNPGFTQSDFYQGHFFSNTRSLISLGWFIGAFVCSRAALVERSRCNES